MNAGPIISNSSPLIALTQIGSLDLLRLLFGTVLVPPAVRRETAASVGAPAWLVERVPAQPLDPRVPTFLDLGEHEVLALALELGAYRVIVDERPARRAARMLGLPVIGTLGVLVLAKDRGLIDAVRPRVHELIRAGFYLAHSIYQDVLHAAGEA